MEREFGTGALKITPGHDPNDYEIGKRCSLEMINIMSDDGSMNAHAGPYEGLDRFEARKKLWADMKVSTSSASGHLHRDLRRLVQHQPGKGGKCMCRTWSAACKPNNAALGREKLPAIRCAYVCISLHVYEGQLVFLSAS